MDLDRFWELVEAGVVAGDVDCEAQAERLAAMLEQLPPEEIASFERHFSQRLTEAYRWDLWGLAYQLNGGCSDDGFVYFRCWLLAQGRVTWEAALADPDSLMDHPVASWSGQELECEPMLYVAFNAYHARAEAELPADSHVPQPSEPLGERWDFEVDGEVRRRRPGAVGEGGYPLGMDVGDLPDGLPPGRLLALAAPPRTREHAEHLALEHLLVCAENLWNHGDWTFPGYVDRILGADLWAFRWDD